MASSIAKKMKWRLGVLSSSGMEIPLGYIQEYRANEEAMNRDNHARS